MSNLSRSTLPFFLFLFSCSGEGGNSIFSSSDLPENPEKIVIEWNEGGGMLPEGQNIYISLDSSYYYNWHDQTKQKLYFNTSEEELNEIYQVCIDNDFDGIRLNEEEAVCDRGGTSIRLIIDGKYYDKNSSGGTFIHESDIEEYAAVENKIYGFAMSKIEDMKIKTTIKVSPELTSNYLVYINVNGRTVFNSDTDDSLLLQSDTLLYEAVNGFDLQLYDKDSLDNYGYAAFLKSYYFSKVISDTSNVVEFGITKEGELTGK